MIYYWTVYWKLRNIINLLRNLYSNYYYELHFPHISLALYASISNQINFSFIKNLCLCNKNANKLCMFVCA